VDLKGILKVDYGLQGADNARMRVIFYSEPLSAKEADNVKTVPDVESNGARWVTLKELLELRSRWRGDELYKWGTYLENGGQVFPITMFELPEGRSQKPTDKAYSLYD